MDIDEGSSSSDCEDQPGDQQVDSSQDDSSSSEESESAAEFQEKLLALRHKLADNPYDYQAHLDIVNLLRTAGELEQLRQAREDFSQKFPLSPELWLEWINDEKSVNESDRSAITALFERAVSDYASVDLWLEYSQFAMGGMTTEGPESVRTVIEAGLMQVGLDCSKSSLLWDLYRVFEKAVSATVQSEEDQLQQQKRIFNLYKRQLSVPLLGMESTYDEFTQWYSSGDSLSFVTEEDLKQIKKSYENSLKQLEKVKPFEDELLITPSKIAEYTAYAEANCTPAFVQCLYERGITCEPLNCELWLKYLTYLEKKVKIEDISVKAFKRASRNCPWYGSIWSGYIRCQERYHQTLEQIVPTLERALASGLSACDLKDVWITYLDCMRRKTNFDDEKQVQALRETLNSAADHLAGVPEADVTFSVLQYSARIEAVFCKNISAAREIWENMLQVKELSSKAQMWLEYFNLEYTYGNKGEAKKLLYRALQVTWDWPESIGTLLVKLEREEGESLEAFERAVEKYHQVMKKIEARKSKSNDDTTSTIASSSAPASTWASNKLNKDQPAPRAPASTTTTTSTTTSSSQGKQETRKRKATTGHTVQSAKLDGKESTFQRPNEPPVTQAKRIKSQDKSSSTASSFSSSSTSTSTSISTASIDPTSYLKPSTDHQSDSNDLLTVYASNLDFSITDEAVTQFFSHFGPVSQVRLVRDYKGRPKGFAYIQFSSIESVKKALASDRAKLNGRPVFISEVGRRKEFQFSMSEEKNKLFISKLANDVDERLLREIFEKYGALKDVRIVTYRNGHSKGCAYVEYVDELSAGSALKATDGMLIKGKNIQVAISDPRKGSKSSKSESGSKDVQGTPGTGSSKTLGSGGISATRDFKRGIAG